LSASNILFAASSGMQSRWLAFQCILGRDRLRRDQRGRSRMRRREFIAGIGAAAAWPVVSINLKTAKALGLTIPETLLE
jgi:hypothetical protein